LSAQPINVARLEKLTTDHLSLTTVFLPARLVYARNLALQSQRPEAQTADAELAQEGPRPSAQLATIVLAAAELRLPRVFHPFCSGCHKSLKTAVSYQPSAFSLFALNQQLQTSSRFCFAPAVRSAQTEAES
jgi:hypothetical protein